MDKGQQQHLQKWLAEKWKHGPCPVCATNRWEPLANLGQIQNLLPSGQHGGNRVPVLLIYCTNCGYTLPINALVAGFPPPTDDEEESEDVSESEGVQNANKSGGAE